MFSKPKMKHPVQAHFTEIETAAIQALLAVLAAHDPVTGEHTSRVACFAQTIAEAMGMGEDAARLHGVDAGARLHDIGKIGVPAAILQKAANLTDEEWEVIRRHPREGRDLLHSLEPLRHIAEVVHAHHERWDGTGYPQRLRGDQIPLESRIFAVADAFDAMAHDRPYRQALAREAVRAELVAYAGTQFDPTVIAAALNTLEALYASMENDCPHGATGRTPNQPEPSRRRGRLSVRLPRSFVRHAATHQTADIQK